ncbi:ankyrin repeat protein [Cooperia oncophora]
MYLQGANMNVADYDGRTALHIAASEGHEKLVKFFLGVAKVNPCLKDRWGRTPVEDARLFNKPQCVRLLEGYCPKRSCSLGWYLEESDDKNTETVK